MMSSLFLAAALATGTAPATPAPDMAARSSAAERPAGRAAAPSATTRYCVKTEPTTGSILAGRVCQTRDAWLREGFDPLTRR